MNGEIFSGNILLFYSFDVGDDIDFNAIRSKGVLKEKLAPLSPYFKDYNIPLSFEVPAGIGIEGKYECFLTKIHRFGVISLCYQIPFEDSLENLKRKLIDTHKELEKQSNLDARKIFNLVESAVEKRQFFHLKESYYVIQVRPPEKKLSPALFRERYGSTIASLLRLELTSLSAYQKAEILSTTVGYSDEDFVVIDSEASFIYDYEFFELLEFFEHANIQHLELKYFDKLLDRQLESFYLRPYKVPMSAYIPLFSGRVETSVSQLARLRVDISVITERLESSIQMAGDTYFTRIYSMLGQQLGLHQWKGSIQKKLDIIQDFYDVYQQRLDAIHAESLEIVIILLIAVEIILAFVR
jgi:hypothetical protein